MKTLEDFFSQILKDIITDRAIQTDENGNEYIAKESAFNTYLSQILGSAVRDEDIKKLAKVELTKALKGGLSRKYILENIIKVLIEDSKTIFENDIELKSMVTKIIKDFLKTKAGKEMLSKKIIEDMGKWDKWRAEKYVEQILGIK